MPQSIIDQLTQSEAGIIRQCNTMAESARIGIMSACNNNKRKLLQIRFVFRMQTARGSRIK